MSRALFLLPLLLVSLLMGCAGETQSEGSAVLAETEGCKGPDGGLVLLCNFMSGEFQLSGDGTLPAKVRLMVIWPETKDSYWIYQESQLSENAPPRQLVHHLTGKDGHYKSTVHHLADPERFLDARSEDFDAITPEQLLPVAGCVIPLEREEEFLYSGVMPASDCILGLPQKEGATLGMKVTPRALIYTEILEGGEPVEMVFQKSGV